MARDRDARCMKTGITLLITGGSGYVSSVFLQKYFSHDTEHDSSREKVTTSREITLLSKENERLVQMTVNKIILVDICKPDFLEASSGNGISFTVPVEYKKVDLTDTVSLNEAFSGADVVFHLASYGMSGRDQLHPDLIWKVNVQGTDNVVKACVSNNVKALVFTSTVNVVFGGQRIENGDETLPYYDVTKRKWDNYGNSKTQAEKAVLQANGTLCDDESTVLRTSVLRLPGIYGPNERRHLPRVVGLMRQGLFKVTYGDNPVVEFIHSENVTKALMLSASKLLDTPTSVVAGQAYFVSDGAPINNFEFFRPLTEALGIPFPSIALPRWLIFYTAFLVETVYWLFHRIYDFQPLLCRAEVYKTAQTHYFSIEKARRDLNYEPDYQNDMSEIAAHYRRLYHPDNQPVTSPNKFVRLLTDFFLVCIAVCLIMSCIPSVS